MTETILAYATVPKYPKIITIMVNKYPVVRRQVAGKPVKPRIGKHFS